MDLTIRNASPADLPAIISLMQEFADYEDLGDYFDATVERLHRAMFGDGSYVEGLVALDDNTAIGYPLFYPSFSSFQCQQGLYLEDIYVKPKYRRGGTGLKMLKEIARTAAGRGFERIDFQVLDWNMPAVNFYKKLGAVNNPDETHFKFADEAFHLLAS